MIRKLLIANRGEIAARIIRTCKKLDIETVAVYSEADRVAPFVSQADEAYLLGGPKVQESYLNVPKVLEIASKTNADAIHPGYGFLSENDDFARSCERAGLLFIGPSPASSFSLWGIKSPPEKQWKQRVYSWFLDYLNRLRV